MTYRTAYQILACFLLVVVSGVLRAETWPTEVESGLNWLSVRVNADGSVSGEDESTARAIQVRHTVLDTLYALGEPVPAALSARVAEDASIDTEALALKLDAKQRSGGDVGELTARLRQSSNTDGGFGVAPGAGSDHLDTTSALWVLARDPNDADAVRAATFVSSAVGTLVDSARTDPQGVYEASQALRALRDVAVRLGVNGTAEQLVTYLVARKSTAGVWGDSVALTALAYMQVRDFTSQEPLAGQVRTYLAATQSADGSWGGDPYVTALALHAWVASYMPPINPLRATIRARVVDAQTLLPLRGVQAQLTGAVSTNSSTPVDGRLSFTDLGAGNYTLQLGIAGYAQVVATTRVNTGQIADFGDIRLTRLASATTGTVSGMVRAAANGAPLSGVSVTANGSYNTVTASDGSYQISNVPPGVVTMEAHFPGYADATDSATLAAGGMLLFSPNLSPVGQTATIQGVVKDATTDAALPGVTVTAGGVSTTTNAQGQYTLDGLSGGVVSIATSLPGYDPINAVATLSVNEILDFSPRLYPTDTSPEEANTAGVSGVVLDAGSNAPLAEASITAVYETHTVTLQTDAQGRFELKGIDAGSVDLNFSVPDYQAAAIAVALKPLSVLDIGQVRLRKTDVQVLLPDLMVKSVSRTGAMTDPQSLALSGNISVTVANAGSAESQTPVAALAFYDVDRDGRYDPSLDTALGQAEILPMGLGQEQAVDVAVQGVLPFRDAPIHVLVDSLEVLAEANEANNVATTASICELKPDRASFQPRLKWAWTGSQTLPDYRQVMSMPIVVPLEDTDGDGRTDQDDVPSVVFHAFAGGAYYSHGVLRALNGLDGHELWTLTDPLYRTSPTGTPAAADLNGDGHVEIV